MTKGQVIGIIEAMKLMNEIEAEVGLLGWGGVGLRSWRRWRRNSKMNCEGVGGWGGRGFMLFGNLNLNAAGALPPVHPLPFPPSFPGERHRCEDSG